MLRLRRWRRDLQDCRAHRQLCPADRAGVIVEKGTRRYGLGAAPRADRHGAPQKGRTAAAIDLHIALVKPVKPHYVKPCKTGRRFAMPLKGEVRTKYMREYMQRYRATERVGKAPQLQEATKVHISEHETAELRAENGRLRNAARQAEALIEQLQAELKARPNVTSAEVAPGVVITPDMLSLTSQQKLEVAKRVMERKLNAEHAARMRNLNEEVRQCVLQEGKEYISKLQKNGGGCLGKREVV